MAVKHRLPSFLATLTVPTLICQVGVKRWSVGKSSSESSEHAESSALSFTPWSQQWSLRCTVRQSHRSHIGPSIVVGCQDGRLSTRPAHVGGSVLVWKHQLVVRSTQLIQTRVSRRPPWWCVFWTFCNVSSCPVTKRAAVS